MYARSVAWRFALACPAPTGRHLHHAPAELCLGLSTVRVHRAGVRRGAAEAVLEALIHKTQVLAAPRALRVLLDAIPLALGRLVPADARVAQVVLVARVRLAAGAALPLRRRSLLAASQAQRQRPGQAQRSGTGVGQCRRGGAPHPRPPALASFNARPAQHLPRDRQCRAPQRSHPLAGRHERRSPRHMNKEQHRAGGRGHAPHACPARAGPPATRKTRVRAAPAPPQRPPMPRPRPKELPPPLALPGLRMVRRRLAWIVPLTAMAVMLETSLGDMVFDLHTDLCPKVGRAPTARLPARPRPRPVLGGPLSLCRRPVPLARRCPAPMPWSAGANGAGGGRAGVRACGRACAHARRACGAGLRAVRANGPPSRECLACAPARTRRGARVFDADVAVRSGEWSICVLTWDEDVQTCVNFLKLCKRKYYNNCLFHSVEKEFIAQSGDPTNTGKGGESIFGLMQGAEFRFFADEIHDHVKHKNIGTLAMVNKGPDTNGSQFYITLRSDLDFLDGKYTIFGEIAEGEDVLERINAAYCDKQNRPYRNIRIKHTHVLDDPFDDLPRVKREGEAEEEEDEPASPEPERDDRPEADDEIVEEDDMTMAEAERATRASEAKSRAVVLEMIGDIPDAEMKPAENVVFVAKLNPLTQDADLDIIFGRFGPCTSNIIRDRKTGDSLNYAFIEFETQEAAEAAYEKMNNVIIDDRRIKVDFSQSAHKQWRQFNLQRRENQINKRQQMARDMKSSGTLSGPSSQVVGGNDYQREVTNKWAGTPGHAKEYSASVESKLGGFRDRKEGTGRGSGRGGRFDVQGSSGLGPAGRGREAVVPAWKMEQRVKEEDSGRDTGLAPSHGDGSNPDARDSSGRRRLDRATDKRDRSSSRERDRRDRRDRSALPLLEPSCAVNLLIRTCLMPIRVARRAGPETETGRATEALRINGNGLGTGIGQGTDLGIGIWIDAEMLR